MKKKFSNKKDYWAHSENGGESWNLWSLYPKETEKQFRYGYGEEDINSSVEYIRLSEADSFILNDLRIEFAEFHDR